MKRVPLTYGPPKWTAQEREHFRQAERDYHVRAFGEELARVNLDLSLDQRRRYLEWMRNYARRHGIRFSRDAHPAFRVGPK